MRLAAAVLLGALIIEAPAQAEDCAGLRSRLQALAASGEIEALKAGFEQAVACDPQLGDWLGRRIAIGEYNRATESSPVDEPRLVASLVYGRPWQTLATLGDLANDRKDRSAAARYYQDALVEIADANRTPTAPAAEVISSIRSKAEAATLLSPTYVALARGRDGSPIGLGATSLRGIEVTTTALPIWFEFGRADFSPSGKQAADDLVALLRGLPGGRKVTLVGHTDTVGDADFNRRLSLRRAELIRDYVVSQGIANPIDIAGKGEEEPYEPDDPSQYSHAELEQMSRRVELEYD